MVGMMPAAPAHPDPHPPGAPDLPGPLRAAFEAAHGWGVRQPALQRFTEVTRVLLSAGFFGPGMVKLLGFHFAEPGHPDAAGRLFDALYGAGLYWNFIGGAQVAAAVLLVIPALAHVGALFMAVVILNIFVITYALQFHGTVFVTFFMLLGAVYLLLWDYPRWKTMLPGVTTTRVPPRPRVATSERAGYLLCALSGWMAFSVMRGFIPPDPATWLFVTAPFVALGGSLLVAHGWLAAVLAARRRVT